MSNIIDGKAIAQSVREDVARGVKALKKRTGKVPKLSVILVGEDPASKVYVGHKSRFAAEVGIDSDTIKLPEDTPQDELLGIIDRLNADRGVHGLLVQLPVPKHLDAETVTQRVASEKDVDGITYINFGKLLSTDYRRKDDPLKRPPVPEGTLEPCTPSGVMEMLYRHDVKIEGKVAVVVGRSNIVGKPIGVMLMREHATVIMCHSRTKDLDKLVGTADILVASIGKAEMIRGAWIKKGAVVIDVGMNRMEDGKLKGDVEFEEAKKRASLITPVPGGVGPMTIAMLLKNTLKAAEKAIS
ncbi:MAG: bifunctional 5,10-methylenetetrahydrofolate dehydrogenase/5,10-methenyltetrahydrofolate cyclohydrolase [Deltaproteobacteria bacterium]|uniref:Bifunctional protein FolD n=1 Tax=Candidatus Zymogenus saltonus TaxID=2844893 RepID=A0A9D8PPP0_9DELT|nr:bifunctional 5,10-methylenetetrahydrofolate dehydrogenase/5,10-methenyltetrahydrofolate cyclohydrolase [Candidatus Zymogenus saltonus]